MKPLVLPDDFDFSGAVSLWAVDSQSQVIRREFVFTDFVQAFEFMKRCAVFAEEIDHHPDWSNSWNTVKVKLTTHSASHLTELDIQLAQQMDLIAQELSALPHPDPLR